MNTPQPYIVALLILISIIQFLIKGIALWRASRLSQRNWFIVLFVLIPFNDMGIIEIIYLFRFANKRLTVKEIKSWFKKPS